MASLFGKIGDIVAGVGRSQNLPEFGISEFISGIGGGSSAPPPSFSATGGGVGGGTRVAQKTSGFGNIMNQGQVLGAQAPTGGGQAPQQQPQGEQGLPLEQAPSEPSIDFDALIAPALGELSNLQASAQTLLGGAESQAEAFRAAEEASAERERQSGLSAVAERERQTQQRGEASTAEQRRGFSEIAKGLRARFGSGVSTGLGAESIMGAQTMRNIASIRSGVQETMNTLASRKDQLEDIFNDRIKQSNFEAAQLKQQARDRLFSVQAQIAGQKATLQSRKAEMVLSAMQSYRNVIADVNARNAAFQQQLFSQRQATNERIRVAQTQAQQTLNTLPEFTLSPGQTRAIPLSQLGGEGALAGLENTQLPGGVQFGTAGPFGVFSAPEKENNNNGINPPENL